MSTEGICSTTQERDQTSQAATKHLCSRCAVDPLPALMVPIVIANYVAQTMPAFHDFLVDNGLHEVAVSLRDGRADHLAEWLNRQLNQHDELLESTLEVVNGHLYAQLGEQMRAEISRRWKPHSAWMDVGRPYATLLAAQRAKRASAQQQP